MVETKTHPPTRTGIQPFKRRPGCHKPMTTPIFRRSTPSVFVACLVVHFGLCCSGEASSAAWICAGVRARLSRSSAKSSGQVSGWPRHFLTMRQGSSLDRTVDRSSGTRAKIPLTSVIGELITHGSLEKRRSFVTRSYRSYWPSTSPRAFSLTPSRRRRYRI
jgi:hypothetical protein